MKWIVPKGGVEMKNLLFKTVMSCGDVNAIDFILKFLVNRL